jgi:hypothetical protein
MCDLYCELSGSSENADSSKRIFRPSGKVLERLPFLWKIVHCDVDQSGLAVAGIDGDVLFKRLHVVKPGTAK